MECDRLKTWHDCWNSRNKVSRLDLESGYTVNIYPLCVNLYDQLKKGASYCRYGNNTLP